MAQVGNLTAPVEKWTVGGTALTSLMDVERRHGILFYPIKRNNMLKLGGFNDLIEGPLTLQESSSLLLRRQWWNLKVPLSKSLHQCAKNGLSRITTATQVNPVTTIISHPSICLKLCRENKVFFYLSCCRPSSVSGSNIKCHKPHTDAGT